MKAPQKRCGTSVVGEHFHLETPNKVRCMYCDRQLAYCNNTSSMMRHLRSTHPAILQGADDVAFSLYLGLLLTLLGHLSKVCIV